MTGGPSRPSPAPRNGEHRTSHAHLDHRALLYASAEEFREAATAYFTEGAEAGDVLVAILPTRPPTAQHAAAPDAEAAAAPDAEAGAAPDAEAAAAPGAEGVGVPVGAEAVGLPGGSGIEVVDAAAWFSSPMRALAAFHERGRTDWWRRGRLRVLAEPPWGGRSPLEIVEWKRHESLMNVVFESTPTILTCAYDLRTVPADVLEDVGRTHPAFADAAAAWSSPSYTDPADFYAECNARPLDPPPRSAEHRRFTSGQLPDLRFFLTGRAERFGVPADRRLPFVLAANEVATAVIRNGGGRGDLWIWATADELVCELADPASRVEDRFLGHLPPRLDRPAEAAMWAVRCLCHIVEIRSDDRSGTRVRLHTRLDAP
ncbi:anti-sigma factor RsbA family regulatory protein [Actinomadura rupiterrae]|uniref:anti-sigma factor RsbA family regulatory protein n=1 Tax=Actinomadura rupiterrae TaxID=559627 RepID=UPI0020A34BE8|nr:sensor histidine kinase [Actinomadura rupiterrae]MCP2334933.1 hypothetical protein [Actinomadura rupiterrae]